MSNLLPKGHKERPEDGRFTSGPWRYPLFWTCGRCFALVDADMADLHYATHAASAAGLSAVIRDYLTNETDISAPSLHATTLTHLLTEHESGAAS